MVRNNSNYNVSRITAIILAIFITTCFLTCSSKMQLKKEKQGNTETITATKDDKILYRIIYTSENGRKIKGEYWESKEEEKEKEEKKATTNLFADTELAEKFEKQLAEEQVIDESDIKLNIESDGTVLNFVKKVHYNKKDLPKKIITRGFKIIPVLGLFNLKTDKNYYYNERDQLIKIVEKNINVDTLLLNLAIGNVTTIKRDRMGRPVEVIKTIGSVPPAIEKTEYTYWGNTLNMKQTVYQKAGFDMKSLEIVPSETITVLYAKGIPWQGMKKYEFSLGKNITGISIYDEVNQKQKLDGSNFMQMSKVDQGLFIKNIYDLLENEKLGPKWRLGELPDIPQPFLIYKDQTWW